MKLPIKYKLANGKLWVRWGLTEEWKIVRATKAKKVIPITQDFGADFIYENREMPQWNGKWFYKEILNIPGHNGIDFEAPTGTRLYAPYDGEITELIHSDGLGIRLKGREHESIFFHLQEWHCSLGQKVKEGDFIALTDNTGRYTIAPHLHWGVRAANETFINDPYHGYRDFRGLIEDLEINALPWDEGQCLIRTGDKGQFYVVENGDLVYKSSDKDPITRHIPIVDFFLEKRKTGLPPNFILPIDEQTFKVFEHLIK